MASLRHVAAFCLGMGVLLGGASAAQADGSSVVTLGVGGGIGIHEASGPDAKGETAFLNQANVRVKLLYFLGADFAYDLSRDSSLREAEEGKLQYKAKMRLTAMLYPYSGDTVAFYLGVGVGGTKMSELFKFDSLGNSYHAGIGMEFHLASHVTIDASFFLLAPGVKSIESNTVARVEAALAKGGDTLSKMQAPGIDDFLSLKNHEFMIRLFLFL